MSGYFVLAKGKNGEDKMRTSLVSLPVNTHSDTCFSFWFQMLVRAEDHWKYFSLTYIDFTCRRIPE